MKILIISHNSFSATHNNGKTLSAMFSAFQPEELCQLYFTAIGQRDYSRCKSYYYISDAEALKSIIRRNRCGYALPQSQDEVSEALFLGSRKKHPNTTIKFFRSIVWRLSAWYRGGLSQWLTVQKPDVVFFVGGDSFFSHEIAVKLSKRLGIPLATYFTDDYVLNSPSTFYTRCLKYHYRKTIAHSMSLFAIGDQMANDYFSYYHRVFFPIMNIVNIPNITPRRLPLEEQISICYFGGLHLGRARQLIRFASFMRQKVSVYLNKDYSISVYSFATPLEDEGRELKRLGVQLYPGITGDELRTKMEDSDVLLHVESTKDDFYSLTKLSVSTKIPEYMSLAKPVIAFGPADIASFRVIADANSSLVVNDVGDEKEMDIQAKKLANILNSAEQLYLLAKDNYEYAKTHFDRAVVSKKFRLELLKLSDSQMS